jgi:fibronectin-binding autotransporter adhesin
MWTNGANLSVGSAGTGTLNILNGGQVTDTVGEIGLLQGSAGTVLVDGTNSTWTVLGLKWLPSVPDSQPDAQWNS